MDARGEYVCSMGWMAVVMMKAMLKELDTEHNQKIDTNEPKNNP